MLMDLDHFKDINDTLGHHIGDQLLCAVADRLRSVVREDDLVARLGGDEFALLCADLEGRAEAEALAARIIAGMEDSFLVDGVRLDIGCSLGFALSPDHGDHAQTLLQRADVALYSAKIQRGAWAGYEASEDDHSVEKLALLGDLREGVARDELVVHFQPLCDTQTGEVLSVEALVRWQHPVLGLLQPDRFIHLAESTGLIVPLTQVVLEKTLEQLRCWDAAGLHLDAAVNLSARQLTDLDLPEQVAAALERHGLAPGRLVLEVTESHIVSDATRAAIVLGRLREVGVRLAVDDFGTGYSSLTQLRSLAVDVLKIDRSFVTHMSEDENDALIVRSTIDLGHGLGLRVVAEGVEDARALEQLRLLGCDVVQGYFLCRPVPGEQVLAWARGREAGAAVTVHVQRVAPSPAQRSPPVIVVAVALLAVLLVPLLGGRLSRLGALGLRRAWLVPAALGLQVLVISVVPQADPRLLAGVHVGTYVLAGAFVWLNRAVPGLVLLGAGAACNGVTIALNGGVLPASARALERSGFRLDAGEFTNSGVLEDPVLPWLGDVFWVPAGLPLANVFSVGDVLIVAGLVWLVHGVCGTRLPRVRRDRGPRTA